MSSNETNKAVEVTNTHTRFM